MASSNKLDQARYSAAQEECAKQQTKVSQFCDGVIDSVGASKMAHEHAMNAEKENIKLMNKSAQAKQTEIAQLQDSEPTENSKTLANGYFFFFFLPQELAREKQTFEESTSKLFELKEQLQTKLPQELAAQRQQLIATQQEIDKQRRLFDEVNKEKEYKTTELTLGRDFYRKHLALDFQRVDDNRLRFVFTHIDPANHDRQFIFSVFVNSANRYELVECEPRLPVVDSLIDDLNADNNFSRFVQRMRAQFRAVALH